ncbi:hypothetical protein TRIUR3_11879 [Triticum urartu]|uniref:Uncharacterized protein n=1 Tax=Triticum urartu TaxID=4572 RepID=M7YGM3_TRIUA|nr:hypothetical protein TRIUR3_11879 [Triticum urartu]
MARGVNGDGEVKTAGAWDHDDGKGIVENGGGKALSSHGKEEAGREVLEQIQEKKERLYDLILRHGYKRNDGSMCYSNVQLMHHLSAHIKPRPQSIACL